MTQNQIDYVRSYVKARLGTSSTDDLPTVGLDIYADAMFLNECSPKICSFR